ncbi:MAG: alpha/beta hydrolase [Clostridia bacterium]|nr:alpha/beta hydrolase [Clostridia bacterium]
MSIRAIFFRAMMHTQNINPIIHPEMQQKMKAMSDKYSHTKSRKGYTLECLKTAKGTRYQRLKKEGTTFSNKVVMYIHGGCYISGLTYNYRDFCTPFCDLSEGIEIILLDYSLMPEYKYPVQLNEAIDLWNELTKVQQIKPENIIVGGDSSGGNLTLALMLYLRDSGCSMPNSIFLLSAWTDMTASGKSYAVNYQKDVEIGDKNGLFDEHTRQTLLNSYLYDYIGDTDRTNPYISPAFADYSGFPPMLLFAGEDEMLLDDTLTVYKKAKQAGVDIKLETQPKMFHSYVLYTDYMPESKHSYHTLNNFILNRIYRSGMNCRQP